jgi:CRISPR/Cas system-associated exonuclease Cas4 (RecB family)
MTRIQSPTSINCYLKCPRKYYLRYIKGRKQKPSIHLIRGRAVHDAIAGLHQLDLKVRAPPERAEQELLGLFNKAWANQSGEIRKLGLRDETVNGYYKESIGMLVGWLKRADPKGALPPETEVRLFSKTHGVMGIIDAISRKDGKVSLIDYKTGKWDEITHELRVQMAIYGLLYKENYGQLPDTIVLDFLSFQKAIAFKVTDEYPEYAVKLSRNIHQMTSSRDEKDYPCKCGGWCEKDFV